MVLIQGAGTKEWCKNTFPQIKNIKQPRDTKTETRASTEAATLREEAVAPSDYSNNGKSPKSGNRGNEADKLPMIGYTVKLPASPVFMGSSNMEEMADKKSSPERECIVKLPDSPVFMSCDNKTELKDNKEEIEVRVLPMTELTGQIPDSPVPMVGSESTVGLIVSPVRVLPMTELTGQIPDNPVPMLGSENTVGLIASPDRKASSTSETQDVLETSPEELKQLLHSIKEENLRYKTKIEELRFQLSTERFCIASQRTKKSRYLGKRRTSQPGT